MILYWERALNYEQIRNGLKIKILKKEFYLNLRKNKFY